MQTSWRSTSNHQRANNNNQTPEATREGELSKEINAVSLSPHLSQPERFFLPPHVSLLIHSLSLSTPTATPLVLLSSRVRRRTSAAVLVDVKL